MAYKVSAEGWQIIALHTGPRAEIELLQATLKDQGVVGAPYHPPSEVGGPSVLRLLVSARLNDDDLKSVVEKCAEKREFLSILTKDTAPIAGASDPAPRLASTSDGPDGASES